jgi:hypothetical protein
LNFYAVARPAQQNKKKGFTLLAKRALPALRGELPILPAFSGKRGKRQSLNKAFAALPQELINKSSPSLIILPC